MVLSYWAVYMHTQSRLSVPTANIVLIFTPQFIVSKTQDSKNKLRNLAALHIQFGALDCIRVDNQVGIRLKVAEANIKSHKTD